MRSRVTAVLAVLVLLMGPFPSVVRAEEADRASGTGARAAALGSRPVGEAGADRRSTALWGWPLVGTPEIVRGYDPPARRWLPGHRGIDLGGLAGEQVLAVDAGVVSFSGQIAGVGIVSVRHASGLRSTYQPVGDRVPEGSRVRRGERLGVLEVGGHCVLLDCLHLGARRGDTYVDPTPLLHPLELSLLPLEPAPRGP